MERSAHIRDARLDAVIVPRGVEYLWNKFWSMFTGEALSLTDIEVYARLTAWDITPLEVEALMEMSKESSAFVGELIHTDGGE